ncbi:MAG: hypothetical protein ABIK09_14815 [Pseudomonadota bacterium]
MIGLSLLVGLLGGPDPDPVPAADGLGMGPRPTNQCGGRKRIEKWDAERELRLTERANKAISRFAHGVGARLGAGEYEGRLAAWRAARSRWSDCVDGLRPVETVCAAVAARRAELCVYAPWEATAGCLELVEAARDLEHGGPPLQSMDTLTPGTCARGGILLSTIPAAQGRCDGILWREAIRTNEPRWCDALLDPARRTACLAVYSASPDLCPGPGPQEAGVLLDRRCRDATLDPGWAPEITGEWGGVRLRFSLVNAFPSAGRCRTTVALQGAGGTRRVNLPWFPLAPAEAEETVAVTPVDVALQPASPSDRIDIETTCSWALEEPGKGKERGVMGLIAW